MIAASTQGMGVIRSIPLASRPIGGDPDPVLTTMLLLQALGSGPIWIDPPSGGANDDGFGRALAVSGNLLLVGSPGRSVWGYRSGDVQAYFKFTDQWQPIGDVLPGTLEAWDEFGTDIVLDGERGAIACPGKDRVYLVGSVHGACFITGSIDPPPGYEGTRFGTSVAMHGDLLVIGAQLDDTIAIDAGAVHVYRYDGAMWNHEAHLVPTNAVDFAWAGRSVAVHDDRLAFGANLEPVGEVLAAGSVYLYRHTDADGWSLEERLTHPDPGPGDYLGYDVAMDGNRLIAGAILADGPDGQEDIGEVVTWSLNATGVEFESTISPPDDIGGEFGFSIAMHGDQLAIGAIFNGLAGPVAGAAYRMMWTGSQWAWIGASYPPPPQDGSQMGFAVAVDDAVVAIGCPRFEDQPRPGRVLMTPWTPDCPGDTNATSTVDVDDILNVISQWGTCPTCPGDVTEDGVVSVNDLLLVIASWGDCQ